MKLESIEEFIARGGKITVLSKGPTGPKPGTASFKKWLSKVRSGNGATKILKKTKIRQSSRGTKFMSGSIASSSRRQGSDEELQGTDV